MGKIALQEFMMALAYENPDLSCSRFVAMGSKKRFLQSGGPRAAGESGFSGRNTFGIQVSVER